MPHLPLNVLHIGAVPLKPGAVRRPEAAPVHKTQAQLAGCGLDEAGENVVIAHRLAVFDLLEDEVVWSVVLDHVVLPHSLSDTHRHSLVFQRVNPIDYMALHCYRSVAGFAFGS